MKETVKRTGVVLCTVLVAFFALRALFYVDVSGAYAAKLVYKDEDVDISCNISWDDQVVLQHMLCGIKFKDSPSCGFDTDVSITFTVGNDQREITLCPACDGCPIFRVGDGDYYIKISDDERRMFDSIVEKYGMVFPCI